MMFFGFNLDHYRRFSEFRFAGLSTVNLIVGPNNCGKTSLLEAVQILASRGDPVVMGRIARRRGEKVLAGAKDDDRSSQRLPDVSHFFHGHQFDPGKYFSMRGDNENGWFDLAVTIRYREEEGEQQRLFTPTGEILDRTDDRGGSDYVMAISRGEEMAGRTTLDVPVTFEGGFNDFRYERRTLPSRTSSDQLGNVQFLGVGFFDSFSLAAAWDQVVVQRREDSIVESLRVLEPKLEKIHFSNTESTRRPSTTSGIMMAFRGGARFVPLGSLGDGMRRLLALSLALAQTPGGILLIDEIDTGLHWSVIRDMWRMIVAASRNTHTQVFATTHSLDCLRGLAVMCDEEPELANEVSVHKIDPNLDHSIRFSAEDIDIAMRQEIEVR